MAETIQLGEIAIAVTRKDIKHVHLSVHPPSGRVTLVAPTGTRPEVARAYAVSKLGWIRDQQAKLRGQARETPRQFVERESHYLWGRRYLLSVREEEAKPSVRLSHRRITLTVRPGSSRAKREAVMHEWHKSLLHDAVPGLIRKWEPKLGVEVAGYFLQRMKTKWGGCNHRARTHPPEHRTREEAEGSARVRGRPRDASPDRAHPQRAVRRAAEQALPDVARGSGGAERATACCRGVERIDS